MLTYNPEGFLASVTDPLGRVARFTYDAAGRIVSKALPDGQIVQFAYDAAGNTTRVRPPGRPEHAFAYTPRNQLAEVSPPAVPGGGATIFSVDLDHQLTASLRPDGRAVTLAYDAGGRLVSRAVVTNGVPSGADAISYDSVGRPAGVAAASGEAVAYAFDGPLMAGETWSGVVAGSVSVTYDAGFRLASESVNGTDTAIFAYDDDDLLTGVGDVALTRAAQTGFPIGSSMGVISSAIAVDAFGDAISYSVTANGTGVFSNTLTRDALGRLTGKTETVGGSTETYAYTYDAAGQLEIVRRNGVTSETYGYDDNGNRVSATVAGSAVTGADDGQDRLVQYGAATYAHNGAGDLVSKTMGGQTTTYQYDPLGNLLGVTLPDGTAITYTIDGDNRRVGKSIGGVVAKGFLFADRLRVAAELDGAGTVVSRFVYAGGTVPIAMIRGDERFRIITDQVGSVRLVLDAATGAVAQRIDYDSFGNVIQDTNPGFQPFGFGGGLYDPDTGLVRFGTRDYDPRTGRWTAKDTLWFSGRDSNLYRYVRNDPVNRADPQGNQPPPDLDDPTTEIPTVQPGIDEAPIVDEKALRDRAAEIRREGPRERPRQTNDRVAAEARDLAKAAEANARRGKPKRGHALSSAMCGGLILSTAWLYYGDDILDWLTEHGLLSDAVRGGYRELQAERAEAEAQQEAINRPFAGGHPFLYGFLKGFASSPPGPAYGWR